MSATVLLCDDHPVFREGLARVVRNGPGLELVGTAESGREALARIRALAPDVALVDLRLPDLDGIEVARAVARDGHATRVLILSAYEDEELVYGALAAGAAGYVTKASAPLAIVDAVVRVAAGETIVSPGLAGGLAAQIRLRAGEGRPALSPREREVLALLCDGLSAPRIAQRLVLGTTTVKTHLANLYEKLGVNDRAAAVAEAMRRGLIE
jgi:two-component system nitrate/nitrite response regulator NarL